MFNRRDFLKLASLTVATAKISGCGQESLSRFSNKSNKPNILFILTDDQRNDTLGCAGHTIIKTPVIDSLAKGGVHFTNAFVTTSICAASRASILTGTYERTHGYTFRKPAVPMGIAKNNYPQLLRAAGYRTGFFGKYGCELETNHAEMFDEFEDIGISPSYFHKMPDGSLMHETDICVQRAERFIDTQLPDKPFCLSISFNASHAKDSDKRPGSGHFPWPPSTEGMYEDKMIPAPKLSDPDIFKSQPDFLKNSLNRQRYFWRWDTPEKYQLNMKAYFRMISGVDNAIGRIRTKLEQKGLADNTVIIYMADNGYYMGDRGFAGKWSHYEQSLRVPLIIFDPRQSNDNRGRRDRRLALNIDVPATILELAGVCQPDTYQGSSLLTGKKENWRDKFFCEHLFDHPDIPKWEGVRGKRYVYALYFEQNPPYEFLHDLKKDPNQLVNLAEDERFEPILEKMRTQCDKMKTIYENDRKRVM